MNKTNKNMQQRFYFYSFFIVFVYNSRARERLIFTASPKHQTPFNSWCATTDQFVLFKLENISRNSYQSEFLVRAFSSSCWCSSSNSPSSSSTPSSLEENSGSNWYGRITFWGIFSSSKERLRWMRRGFVVRHFEAAETKLVQHTQFGSLNSSCKTKAKRCGITIWRHILIRWPFKLPRWKGNMADAIRSFGSIFS